MANTFNDNVFICLKRIGLIFLLLVLVLVLVGG
jgi:hypothetical protein